MSTPAGTASDGVFPDGAQDCIALVAGLGSDACDVVGHDRGGRVAYRMALDHPAVIRRLTVLDVIPTGEVWARADARSALGYRHRAFLAQPHPLPERRHRARPRLLLPGRRVRWVHPPAPGGGGRLHPLRPGIRRPSRPCARTTGPPVSA